MKNSILFTLLLTFLSLSVLAQQQECSTVLPEKTIEWLKEFRQNPYSLKDDVIDYLPIQFHIVGTSEGLGHYPAAEVFRLLCETNENFEPVGIQFFLNAGLNYLNNDSWYIHTSGNNMMNTNNYNNAINVYIVESPNGNCGYFAGGPDAIALAKNCADMGSSTLTHELGHYFSLPHTFRGWEGGDAPSLSQQERVNGTNCSSVADFFCDTPPDYVYYRWDCPFEDGPLIDPNGVAFEPDGSLYMCYSTNACRARFSPQQIEAMVAYLYSQRTDLLGNPTPAIVPVDNAEIVYPGNGASDIPKNNVLLSWKAAYGATDYFVEIKRMGELVYSASTSDTFHIANLVDEGQHFWNVHPFNGANTCTSADFASFSTVSNTAFTVADLQVTSPSCADADNGSISLEIEGGNPQYTYTWNNGATGASIENIEGGNYSVVVIDESGDEVEYTINVPEPDELEVAVVQTDNLTAEITIEGGVLPYTINWSNGATELQTNTLDFGINTVTVTDGNGCIYTQEVEIIAIQETVNNISCHGEIDGSIELTLSGGTPPYEYNWTNGADVALLEGLEAGIYEVIVQDAADNRIELSYEIIEPGLLSVEVTTGAGFASANVTGGTPPFNYFWPVGSGGSSANGIPVGTFELFVTDANSCFASVPFTMLATGIETVEDKDFSIYPTLLENGQSLTIQTELPQSKVANFTIYNSNGQQFWQQTTPLQSGSQQLTIPIQGFSTGLYLLKMEIDGAIEMRRFVVSF